MVSIILMYSLLFINIVAPSVFLFQKSVFILLMVQTITLCNLRIAKMYEQLGLTQDDIFHKTKLLLSIYRDVVWATLADCNCVNVVLEIIVLEAINSLADFVRCYSSIYRSALSVAFFCFLPTSQIHIRSLKYKGQGYKYADADFKLFWKSSMGTLRFLHPFSGRQHRESFSPA